jgi:hypothetical protein
MRSYNFVLSSTQEPLKRKFLDHYLFLDPVYGTDFIYPTTAWGAYFFNASAIPAAATSYINRVGNMTPIYQQVVGQFVLSLQQEGIWDSLVDGWLLSENLNKGTGSTVYALKNDSNNGVFGQGVNGKLPTWEHTGVRFYNDGTGPAGLGPRIDVPTWTARVSAPMCIATVFSPFSATGITGSGVFGQTSWGGGPGQHFGINYDVPGSIGIYVGNENIDAGFGVTDVPPPSGQYFIMAGALTDGAKLTGAIDSFLLSPQIIGGAGATTALTAVAIGYELSAGGTGFQNAYPYDGLISSGFVFNNLIDYRKFYDIYAGTIGRTLDMPDLLDPDITWDIDAYTYFLKVGYFNISDTDKIIINNFVTQLKASGLWNNMICWIGRSNYNKGSSNILYSLGGDTIYEGTMAGVTWTPTGIQSTAVNNRVVTTKKRINYNARTFYAVANVEFSPFPTRARIMYSAFAEPEFLIYTNRCAGMSLADVGVGGTPGSQVGYDTVTPSTQYIKAAGPTTVNIGFASHAATFGSKTVRHYRNLGLTGTASTPAAWASNITDAETLVLMNGGDDYGMIGHLAFAADFNYELNLTQLTTLTNILKNTICSDLGLP